jgi:predicted transcriptional regulator
VFCRYAHNEQVKGEEIIGDDRAQGLRGLRAEEGLFQRDVEDRMDMVQSAISDIEGGSNRSPICRGRWCKSGFG